jgi:hypothetical protein
MTPEDDEARLRAALAEAHRHDAARTPSFERVRSAALRTPRGGRRLAVAAALATAAVALWFVWIVAPPRPPPTWQPRGTRWIAPTDFLLETPDLVTLRTLPDLDPSTDPLLRSPPAPRRGVP